MKAIYYEVKTTSAKTDYVILKEEDKVTIMNSLMSINSWVQELSLTTNKDIQSVINWYQKSNKKYPYNMRLKKYNSPQSMISGLINNLMFGGQRDFSLVQLDLLQDINNLCIDLIEVIIKEHKIQLQTNPGYTKFFLQIGLFVE